MTPFDLVIVIVINLVRLYMLVLLVRVVLDWVQLLARQWRPTGPVLVMANLVYALTDPPLARIRRVVPMVRAGGMGIDLSFVVLYIGLIVLSTMLAYLMRLV